MPLKILFISNCDPQHLYIIDRIRSRWPTTQIIRPVWAGSPAKAGRLRRLLKKPFRSLSNRIAVHLQNRIEQQLRASIAAKLFTEVVYCLPVERIEVSSQEINAISVRNKIREIAPDVLITSGAPILKGEIYGLAKRAAINVHFGVAPAYRGQHNLFWALYNQEFQALGLTLHYLNEELDAGRILAQVYPALSASDDEVALYAKCSKLAANELERLLQHAEKTGSFPEGQNQPADSSKSRTYRYLDRGVFANVLFVVRRMLSNRLPVRPERVERYY